MHGDQPVVHSLQMAPCKFPAKMQQYLGIETTSIRERTKLNINSVRSSQTLHDKARRHIVNVYQKGCACDKRPSETEREKERGREGEKEREKDMAKMRMHSF